LAPEKRPKGKIDPLHTACTGARDSAADDPPALAIVLLTIAVVEAAFRTLLISAIRRPVLPADHITMIRHPPKQADSDNGNGSCQDRTSFDGYLLVKVAEPGRHCSDGGVLLPPSEPQYSFSLKCFDKTMIDG
jgi:hypothetical protein